MKYASQTKLDQVQLLRLHWFVSAGSWDQGARTGELDKLDDAHVRVSRDAIYSIIQIGSTPCKVVTWKSHAIPYMV